MTTPTPSPTSRPRPLRTVASIIGGLTALVAGLVGSGLLTTPQGDAITGVISAVVAALGAFGVVIAGERKVTPLVDPRDATGRQLLPVGPATTLETTAGRCPQEGGPSA